MSSKLTSLLLVSIFKNVLNDEVISSFVSFLNQLSSDEKNFSSDLKLYSEFISSLYQKSENQNLYDYLKKLIYTDENIISKGCSSCVNENNQLLNTAKYELTLFDNLVSFDYQTIKDLFLFKYPRMTEMVIHLPVFNSDNAERFNIDNLINSYKNNGYGVFSCYSAFKYTELV